MILPECSIGDSLRNVLDVAFCLSCKGFVRGNVALMCCAANTQEGLGSACSGPFLVNAGSRNPCSNYQPNSHFLRKKCVVVWGFSYYIK